MPAPVPQCPGSAASSGRSPAVDSTAVIGDDDEPGAAAREEGRRASGARLQRVDGPMGPVEPQPGVRLCREWKGLTVADLLRDEIVERLPGQLRSAVRHIERGDLAAADRAMPGQSASVLAGPGSRRRERRWLVTLVVTAAVLAAFVVASSFR